MDNKQEMVDFLKREQVDVVVACDLGFDEMVGTRVDLADDR